MNQNTYNNFITLMNKMFQLEESDSLDFGFYKIIKNHNKSIKDYFDKDNGKFIKKINEVFAKTDETNINDKIEKKELLENELGLKGLSTVEIDKKLNELIKIPTLQSKVSQYNDVVQTISNDNNQDS